MRVFVLKSLVVVGVFMAVIGTSVFLNGRALEARVQTLETELARAKATISSLEFYGGWRQESRLGLVEAGVALKAVDIRNNEDQIRKLRKAVESAATTRDNFAYAKLREAGRLLRAGQETEARVMAYGAMFDLAGGSNRYCSPKEILVWDNNDGFPPVIRETFFRGGGPYIITAEAQDGRVVLQAAEITQVC